MLKPYSSNRAGVKELIEWFKLNPGRVISTREAALKLQVTERTAGAYLGYLAGSGLVERTSIYRLKEKACTSSSS